MTGLDLAGRAAALGLSCRELLDLGRSDGRIVAFPALEDGGRDHLRAWIAAGRPVADLAQLVFDGDDSVRALVRVVLRTVPTPVQWFAVQGVAWIEVGRGAAGWQTIAPCLPSLDGDTPRLIALCGAVSDEDLRHTVAHELGHAWLGMLHRVSPRPAVPIDERTHTVRCLQIMSADELARRRYRGEVLADELARLWGFRGDASGRDRLEGFRAEIAAVAEGDRP